MGMVESAQAKLLVLIERCVVQCAAKLASLSGIRWHTHIISIDVGCGDRFRSILARDAQEFIGVFFSNPGERYLVMLSEDSGRALLQAYCNGRHPIPAALEQDTLAEIANILINGLSGELGDLQGMARIISGPTIMRGTKAAIYDRAFGDLPAVGGDAMIDALIHISAPPLAADCTLMLRLDTLSANFLLNSDPDSLQYQDC